VTAAVMQTDTVGCIRYVYLTCACGCCSYALKLRQVANFYNSMAEQIVPSQMALVLREAQDFETIVKEHKVRLHVHVVHMSQL